MHNILMYCIIWYHLVTYFQTPSHDCYNLYHIWFFRADDWWSCGHWWGYQDWRKNAIICLHLHRNGLLWVINHLQSSVHVSMLWAEHGLGTSFFDVSYRTCQYVGVEPCNLNATNSYGGHTFSGSTKILS